MNRKKKRLLSQKLLFIAFLILSIVFIFLLENLENPHEQPHKLTSHQEHNSKDGKTKTVISENKIISKQILSIKEIEVLDHFFDENKIEHITFNVTDINLSKLRNKLKNIFESNHGKIIFKERLKDKNKEIFLFHAFLNEKQSHVLLISTLFSSQKVDKKSTTEKKVAIIIDDIGSKPNIVPLLKSLSIPLTISVLTQEPYAISESSQANSDENFEIIIHLPMQPYNETLISTEHTITPTSTLFQIKNILKRAKSIIPMAKGLNNHQGSMTTSNINAMKLFFGVLKEENLFFIDSRTTNNSVAYKISQEYGVKSSYKDLFLDHIPTIEHSRDQFIKILELFKTKNTVIAIGHPHISTIQAIQENIQTFTKNSITFVHVSQLVH